MSASAPEYQLQHEHKRMRQSPLAKLGMTLVGAMVLGVCSWAIIRVETHEGVLIRLGVQADQLSEAVKDTKREMRSGFEDIKQEIRRTR